MNFLLNPATEVLLNKMRNGVTILAYWEKYLFVMAHRYNYIDWKQDMNYTYQYITNGSSLCMHVYSAEFRLIWQLK